jgi:hypothetical protein
MSNFTMEQLAALEAAITSGTLRVRDGDREVTYHSLDAMIRLRDRMRAELGLAGQNGLSTVIYARFSKGLE